MIGTISEEIKRAADDLQRRAPNYGPALERFALRLQQGWREGMDQEIRQVAMMADEIAFWAYQAKWYFAAANGLGRYDELPATQQRAIDKTFEEHRIAENRERLGNVEPAHNIGS